jgi:hypothetical protein
MSQVWLMLAFPGDDVGQYALRAFAPSKNGKSWFRVLPTREAAIASKRELVEAGIRFVCKKVDKPAKRFAAHPTSGRDRSGFGGALNSEPNEFGWRLKQRRK